MPAGGGGGNGSIIFGLVFHLTFQIIAGTELLHVLRLVAVKLDSHGDTLFHLNEIACGIVDWQQRESTARGAADTLNMSFVFNAWHRIGFHLHLSSFMDVWQLALLIVGFHPDAVGIYDVYQRLTWLYKHAFLNVFCAYDAITRSDDIAI